MHRLREYLNEALGLGCLLLGFMARTFTDYPGLEVGKRIRAQLENVDV